MTVIDKIDKILGEATTPSQEWIRNEIAKGLKDVPEITNQIAMELWHYFDLKIVGKGGKIFKSQPSNKLSDELWHRIGKSLENSEYLTDEGLKKIKKNFYGIIGKWGKLYTMKSNAWEFTG